MVNDRTPDAREAYDILRAVCRADDSSLRGAYRQMRELLELLCRTQTEDDNLQMTDLAARIHAYLHTMAEPYKVVFTLRVFCELPFAQIAALFGKTESWAG